MRWLSTIGRSRRSLLLLALGVAAAALIQGRAAAEEPGDPPAAAETPPPIAEPGPALDASQAPPTADPGPAVGAGTPPPIDASSSTAADAAARYVLQQQSYAPGLGAIVGITGQTSDGAITVRVLRHGRPAAGESVEFRVTGVPSGAAGTALSASTAVTDARGLASTEITLGDKEGPYLVATYLHGSVREAEPVITKIRAMTSSWIVLLVIGLLGGLGLFLYGMDLAGDHLQRAWGEQMRVLLGKLTRNRFSGLLVGTAASGVLQSSSAASVMVVGFVSATMMTLTQAIAVVMGAKVGVTITVQLIAFNIARYALAIVGGGAILIMAAGKREKLKHVGAILLGFGLIFFGLSVMSGSMKPLRGMPEFAGLLLDFSDSPGLAILIGTAFTAIIQSSAATVALCMALASQGLLPLGGAIALSVGSTIGTCATALLASLGSNRDGKRVAVAHLIFSVAAALVLYPLIGPFTELTQGFTAWMGSESAAREIANGYMMYCIIATVLFLPFTAQIEWLTRKILPEAAAEAAFGPKHINEASLTMPVIALDQAQKEVERMARIFGDNLKASMPAILADDKAGIQELVAEDDKLDILERAIRPFLARVAQEGLAREAAARERTLIYITGDIENAGDMLAKEVLHGGEKMAEKKLQFSEQGAGELKLFHEKMVEKFERVMAAFESGDRHKAEEALQLGFKERQLERRLRDAHLERLHAGGSETVSSSTEHLSILAGLASVGGKLDEVAEELLRES